MTYTWLHLLDDFPEPLEAFVRGSLEPYLMDVHVMLGVTGPVIDPRLPPHLLGRSVALTLLTVVSSAADTLYAKRGKNKEKFVGVLKAYYPWDRAPASGLSEEEAADLLYQEFRNPIAHRAGIRPAGEVTMGIFLPFPGSGNAYREIAAFEQSDGPPSNETLNIDSATCHLEVRTFYWGVRKMIEAITADRSRWPNMVDWLQNHRFLPKGARLEAERARSEERER